MAKIGKELREKRRSSLLYRHKLITNKQGYGYDYRELKKHDKPLQRRMEKIAEQDEDFNNNPEYRELGKKRSDLISSFCEKYDILHPYDPKVALPFSGYGVVDIADDAWIEKRIVTFRIDTYQELGIIKDALSNLLNTMREIRKCHGVKISPIHHEEIVKRYFLVWHWRQLAIKYKLSYKFVVDNMKKKGFYKNKSDSQAGNLARQDYRTVCKLKGILDKISKPTKRKPLEPIIKLKEGKKHKALFEKWEGKLRKYGLGLKETYSLWYDTDKLFYDSDGVIKEKLRRELNTKAEIKRRANAKRSQNLRRIMNG